LKIETYMEDDTLVTKLYHNAKIRYFKELTTEKNGIKEIKHFTLNGILSKLEYFKDDKREGVETKYLVSKANECIKSTKTYHDGKLHGECITYNENGEIIKQEVFVFGKVVLKYLRENKNSNEITSINMIDEESIVELSKEQQVLIEENIVRV